MVIRNTQGAEGVLKQYEECLREVHNVPSSVKEVETYRTKLKVNNLILPNCKGFKIHPAARVSLSFYLSSLLTSLVFV